MPLLLKLPQDFHLKGVKKHRPSILYLILDQLLKPMLVFALQDFFLCVLCRKMSAGCEISFVSVTENYRRKIVLQLKTTFCLQKVCKVLDE